MGNEPTTFQIKLILIIAVLLDIAMLHFAHFESLISGSLLFILYLFILTFPMLLIVSVLNQFISDEKYKYSTNSKLVYFLALLARVANIFYGVSLSLGVIYLFVYFRGFVWVELPLTLASLIFLLEFNIKKTHQLASSLISSLEIILNFPQKFISNLIHIRREAIKLAVMCLAGIYLLNGINFLLNLSEFRKCINSNGHIAECYEKIEWKLSSRTEDEF